MRFGVSTHLYHDRRLERDHLAQVAAYGFEAIELFATRSHFDYRDEATIDRLKQWLAGTGLTLNSVHAPITDLFGSGDQWAPTYSNAVSDRERREAAVRETDAALRLAERIPFDVLVVHLGTPTAREGAGDNHRPSAVRSLGEICDLAAPRGVRVAVEVIPNKLSDASALAGILERDIDARHAGICLDFGHAHLMGDVVDAIENASEHIIATHVHDNRGTDDAHLVPGLGTIDWNAALIAMQKIGYAGTYLMELANTGAPGTVLEEARRARQRFERALALS
jgi:sugar phosphate isomerase/epimerase